MADYNSKYSGEQVESLLDRVANGEAGGGGGGGIAVETDPIFSASPAASITEADKQTWSGKQDAISDLATIRSNASKGATAVQPASLASVATSGSYNDLSNKPTIPSAVTESTVSGWGFTKNTGTYSKPSGGIPKTDLASAVQTSLGKADTALQSYTEQYKGTVTGVKINGTTKNPVNGIVDLGTIEGGGSGVSGLPYYIVQSFTIDTILSEDVTNGVIQIDEEDGEGIYNAVADGKVILIPKNPDDGYYGYVIASGYAEDLAYLTFICDSLYFEICGRGNNFQFYKRTLPYLAEGATLGTVYKSDIFSVDFFLDAYNVGGQAQHSYGDEFGAMSMALSYGATIQIKDPMDSYIPLSASTDGETIWFTFVFEGDIHKGLLTGAEVNVELWSGNNKTVILNNEVSTHTIQPNATNFLTTSADVLWISTYNINFGSELSIDDIRSGESKEWKIIIDLYDKEPSFSFPDTVYWANETPPDISGSPCLIEISFIPAFYNGYNVRYLGTWAKFQVGM